MLDLGFGTTCLHVQLPLIKIAIITPLSLSLSVSRWIFNCFVNQLIDTTDETSFMQRSHLLIKAGRVNIYVRIKFVWRWSYSGGPVRGEEMPKCFLYIWLINLIPWKAVTSQVIEEFLFIWKTLIYIVSISKANKLAFSFFLFFYRRPGQEDRWWWILSHRDEETATNNNNGLLTEHPQHYWK